MAELLKMMQSSNGAFKSDLMNSYVAKHKGSYSSAAPGSGFPLQTGAAIFPPSTTTTTTTSNTTGGVDTPDNANIMLQNRTADNNQNTTNTITTTNTNTTTSNSNNGNRNANTTNGNKNRNINTTSTTSSATTTTPTSTNNANKNTTTTACPEQPDSNANVSEVNAVLEEVKAAMPEHLQQLVQQVTDATVDAHMATCLNTHKAVAEARARFEAMKKGAPGGAAPMNMPDMSKLSVSAGSMWEKMMDQMMPELGKAIKFCKSLPGFSELPMEDQMKLIKHGSFDVMMTRFAMLIDNVSETMLDPSHKMVVPRKVIMAMPMGKFLDGFFHVGQQFNPVGLTDGEIGLFSACLIFNPSRPGLGDVKLIAGIQSLYQQALFNHMKQNHSDREEKFSRALKLVPMFRRINEEHSKALGAMKMQQGPDAFDKQFPPMHKEMYLESQQKQN